MSFGAFDLSSDILPSQPILVHDVILTFTALNLIETFIFTMWLELYATLCIPWK